MDYLSDAERAKVASFMADERMVEAVKKVLLAGIYYNGTLKPDQKADPLKNAALGLAFNPSFTNEQLGADLRAFAQGIESVENGFKKLGEIAGSMTASPVKPETNEAE